MPAGVDIQNFEDVALAQEAILQHLKRISQYTQYDRESLFDVLATQQIPNISVDKLGICWVWLRIRWFITTTYCFR